MRLGPALALALAALAAPPSSRPSGSEAPSLLGRAAPSFHLNDLEGRAVSLEGLRGQFVVLHFGASW
jgi:cytochrome oxidase Cu insertion factor (SCO1/SenC/PrrC family)